jgi:hypothetical protein
MRRLAALCAMTGFLFIVGTALAPPMAQAAGGNSAAAKACQKGGYSTLAEAEAPGTAFASQDACVSYAAKGGSIVAYVPVVERGINISYTPTGVFPFCNVVVSLTGFEPNTQYTVILHASNPSFDAGIVGTPETTTDATGASTFSPFSFNEDFGFTAEVDGTTSAYFPSGC